MGEEIRNLLAHLGYSRLEELIGRADSLREGRKQNNRVAKTKGAELGPCCSGITNTEEDRSFLRTTNEEGEVCEKGDFVHRNGGSSDLDRELINNSDIQNVISENVCEHLLNTASRILIGVHVPCSLDASLVRTEKRDSKE